MALPQQQEQEQAKQPEKHVRVLSVYVITIIASLGGWLMGYDAGVISGTELLLRKDFAMTPFMEEMAVSASLFGGMIGAVAGSALSNKLGRKKTIILVACLFALGAALTALSPNYALFLVFRVLVGVSIGIGSLVVPVYISEIAPSKQRGKLVTFNRLALSLAIPAAYGIYLLLARLSVGWRTFFWIECIPAVVLTIGMVFLPESPRWLGSKGRWQAAEQQLDRIKGTHPDHELKEIRHTLRLQGDHGSVGEFFVDGLRLALLVGVGLGLFQQAVGSAAISYYTPTIFKLAGFKSASLDVLITGLVSIISLVACVLALFLLDRLGRRPLLLFSFSGMLLTLVVMGVVFLIGATNAPYIVLICLLVYILAYGVGIGPIFSLMCSEIFPTRLRGIGVGIAMLVNWGATLLVSLTFLTLIHGLGKPRTFWLYAALALVGGIFTWFLVPETKGKSLEQIIYYWKHDQQWP